MKPISEKKDAFLRIFQLIFYVGFIIFWFKDNFPPLRQIKVNALFFLIPLLITSGWRLILKLKTRGFKLPRLSREKILSIAMIILAGLLLRLPYLLHYAGTFTSDEAMFCLEGKHIAEGKRPPICSYGQLYYGTFPSHFFALIFKLFGYSVLAFKLAIFLLYLTFIIFHFLFLSKLFPFSFSLLAALFYCLPYGYLVHISLDGEFILSLLFLLGMAIIYLSYLVVYQNQEKYLSWLGFLIGFSLWTNQILIYFILVGLLIVLIKYKFALKKYLTIFLYALIGFGPQILVEIFYNFHLIKFLTAGETVINWGKLKGTINLMGFLLAFSHHPSRIILVFIVFFGFMILIFYSIRTREYLALKIYNVFFLIFMIIYLLSGHSNRYLVRYLYPLFFCLPILFLAPLLFIKKKIRLIAASFIFLMIFFFYNSTDQYKYVLAVKQAHKNLNQIVSFMKETKQKYWKGDFWTAYLITAFSGEELIVASTKVSRYYQYELFYNNFSQKENFIFLRGENSEERQQARTLIKLLEVLKIPYQKKEFGDCWLIYDIDSAIPYFDPGPPVLPTIKGPKIEVDGRYLQLFFENLTEGDERVSFWINLEIPNYSTAIKHFSLKEKEIKIRIPYPDQKTFSIIYYLDYWGTVIPSTYQEIKFTFPEMGGKNISKPEIVYLYGIGLLVDYWDKRMRICQKEVRIEWNKKLNPGEKLCFILHSPFQFSHLHWYGQFDQEVEVLVNGQLISKNKLKDGRNHVKIGFNEAKWMNEGNVIILRFRYHSSFDFSHRRKTAALLEKIYVERNPFRSF